MTDEIADPAGDPMMKIRNCHTCQTIHMWIALRFYDSFRMDFKLYFFSFEIKACSYDMYFILLCIYFFLVN
jgi:hypothetical protein